MLPPLHVRSDVARGECSSRRAWGHTSSNLLSLIIYGTNSARVPEALAEWIKMLNKDCGQLQSALYSSIPTHHTVVTCCDLYGGFQKNRGTIFGIPRIRNTIFWGLYWGLPIYGNYPITLNPGLRAWPDFGASSWREREVHGSLFAKSSRRSKYQRSRYLVLR